MLFFLQSIYSTNLPGHAYQVWLDLDWSRRAKNSEQKRVSAILAQLGLAWVWAELSNVNYRSSWSFPKWLP